MNVVYGAALSPFVRKVLMVLDHKQVAYQQENILPFRTPAEYVKLNPLRKVPAFKDEYTTLADSSVICDYLEHKYPQRALYPKTSVERAKALWFEEYADSHLQPLLGPGLFLERLVVPVLYRRKPNEALIAKTLKALPAAQDYLESQIPAAGFLVGDLTIADLILPGVFLMRNMRDTKSMRAIGLDWRLIYSVCTRIRCTLRAWSRSVRCLKGCARVNCFLRAESD